MENPFRMIRKRLKLSGRSLGLASSTVSRIENGQYEELSEGMVQALFQAVSKSGADTHVLAAELEDRYGTPYLSEAYLRWRKAKRASVGDVISWPSLGSVRSRVLLGESPMGAFARLTSGSVGRFCTQFCIQVPTLTRYIEGQFGYLSPPQAVEEALTDAGYDELEALFELQREWIDGK